MKYLLDSSAWIDYFEGTQAGEKVRVLLADEKNEFSTSIISIAEIASKARRQGKNVLSMCDAIRDNSNTIFLNDLQARNAGVKHADERRTVKDFGLADAIIWIQAEENKLRIVTKDKHFKKFSRLILLE